MAWKHHGTGLAWGAAVLAGGVLRSWNLRAQVVSDDEMHTVRAVLDRPVAELLGSYGHLDYSLPMAALYRALADAGVRLGETILRLLPLAAGLAIIVVMPLTVQPWLGRRAAAWLAWLLAVSTPLVYYSRVVRPYCWSALLGFLAVAAFARWWSDGGRRYLAAFAAAGALAVWFLPVVAPFVAAPLAWAGLDVLRHRRPGGGRRLVLASLLLAGGVAALFAPAAPDLLEVVTRKAGRTAPGPAVWLDALRLHAGTGSALVAAAVGVLAVAGFLRHLRTDRAAAAYWALPAGVQALAIGVVAPLGVEIPFILERYLLITLPVLLAWVAYALSTPLPGRAATAARVALGVGVIAGLVATGPFADRSFRRSPFMHTKDYLEVYAERGFLPPDAVPDTYRTLLPVLPPGPVLEYPWVPVWHFTDALRIYQEIHGREVVVATMAPALADPRLAFRNMVPATGEGFLASRARFLLLHRDYPGEEARVVEPEQPAPPVRRGLARSLRAHAARRSAELRRSWGPPDWQDAHLEVWDLERVRSAGPVRSRRPGRRPRAQ